VHEEFFGQSLLVKAAEKNQNEIAINCHQAGSIMSFARSSLRSQVDEFVKFKLSTDFDVVTGSPFFTQSPRPAAGI
jgi:hypothetical protein